MLRLTRKTCYAIQAMIALAIAQANGREQLTRDEMAAEQNIPHGILSHVLVDLAKSGLLVSVRGIGGGYRLASDPTRISAADIVRVCEQRITLVPCLAEESAPCPRIDNCSARSVWDELSSSLMNELSAVTLDDLCRAQRRLMDAT
ncbi:MAG: Rrf2 family transcriptional regulator [Anaerolineae bacterium]|nr:Rrf2 family transcriptional regulator [Anaerolineae bacterium]